MSVRDEDEERERREGDLSAHGRPPPVHVAEELEPHGERRDDERHPEQVAREAHQCHEAEGESDAAVAREQCAVAVESSSRDHQGGRGRQERQGRKRAHGADRPEDPIEALPEEQEERVRSEPDLELEEPLLERRLGEAMPHRDEASVPRQILKRQRLEAPKYHRRHEGQRSEREPRKNLRPGGDGLASRRCRARGGRHDLACRSGHVRAHSRNHPPRVIGLKV